MVKRSNNRKKWKKGTLDMAIQEDIQKRILKELQLLGLLNNMNELTEDIDITIDVAH